MALQNTNLIFQVAPIPQNFDGTPAELVEQLVLRSKIVSPTGTNFIYTGDTEPTSNVGPWLKGGTQWYVWDESLKRYVPQDISESETDWFQVGNTTPGTSSPPIWLKTSRDQTAEDLSIGEPISWYVFNGTSWVPFAGITLSGPTSSRPSSPAAYQQYYDTSISTLIWWERSAWRTVDGVPGDIKSVAFDSLTQALEYNPGWEFLGASNESWRGRWISQATKDSTFDFTVGSGIAERTARETYGETDGVKIDSSSSVPYPPTIAFWHLVKL